MDLGQLAPFGDHRVGFGRDDFRADVAIEYAADRPDLVVVVSEGRELAKIHDSVVVKIPLIRDGIKAVSRLTAEGIRTNVTLCFSPMQALLAA